MLNLPAQLVIVHSVSSTVGGWLGAREGCEGSCVQSGTVYLVKH